MYTKEEINLIVLSKLELSYGVNKFLLSDFQSSQPDFQKHKDYLIKTLSAGVYNKVKTLFYDKAFREDTVKELDKKGVKCVTYFSPDYPETLKNIDTPPVTLYCKGNTELLKSNCFSVVGSRRSTPKALADCNKIAGELASAFIVVSGLADGADTSALEGALDAGGKVISVIAGGFDNLYPATGRQLFDRVCEYGLAISEYPPEVLTKPYHFPIRNRIIAGLSRGTLIVSAGEKSGALITADYALEYGRDVFAFPYNIGVPSGKGCNELIKKGAYLTENILDIFKEFGLDLNKPKKSVELSGEELAVYGEIKNAGEAFLPHIAQKLGKPPYALIPVITSLQMKKLVKSLGGNRYTAI